MTGGEPLGRKAFALPPGPHRRNRDGRIGRAERGGASLSYPAPGGIGQHRQCGDVRVLALIRCHALGRVAFHMLDRAEILGGGLFHVFHANIILEIEPSTPLARHGPERLEIVGRILGLRDFRCV